MTDEVRSIDARHDPVRCDCGELATMIISAPVGRVLFPAAGGKEYISPASGKYISTARARRDDFARTDTRPYEGREQEVKEANRKKADIEKKQDAKLHDSVSRAYYQLSPEKRKALSAG